MSDKTTKEVGQDCLDTIKECNLAAQGKTTDETFDWLLNKITGEDERK